MSEQKQDDLPSVEEVMAYARGYEEGRGAAENQEVAALIRERDTLLFDLATEKGRNKLAELRKAEMLEALKMAQLWLDADGRYDMQAINAAIAKAEGR